MAVVGWFVELRDSIEFFGRDPSCVAGLFFCRQQFSFPEWRPPESRGLVREVLGAVLDGELFAAAVSAASGEKDTEMNSA
jgi:hypothetical protein